MVLEAASGTQRWELYRLLSEPVRLRLLALAAEEELAIGELAELLGESQPNVSRHAAPLKQAGLLVVRKQGQRALVKLGVDASRDPVVADALASGRALCESDGSLARVADVIRARDAVAREFFARVSPRDWEATVPDEIGAYLGALGPLLGYPELAIDAGTGDGGLLEVLAPTFRKVVAIDRSESQLARASARASARGWDNVVFVCGEIDGDGVKQAMHGKRADAVFAARLLHHAPRPADVVQQLARLLRPGGSIVLLDYDRHDDESMRGQADLWLGFDARERRDLLKGAGFEDVTTVGVPGAFRGHGPDAHLPWMTTVARKKQGDAHDEPSPRRSGRRLKRGNGHG